jgi:hypothetical protein
MCNLGYWCSDNSDIGDERYSFVIRFSGPSGTDDDTDPEEEEKEEEEEEEEDVGGTFRATKKARSRRKYSFRYSSRMLL